MTLASVLSELGAGGIVAVLVVFLGLVEIVPIKISPLSWIGKRLNKDTLEKVSNMEKKLDMHIAQDYRTKILNFQDDILANKAKTKEQWKEIINAITTYEVYCEDNKITNGLCAQANEFLKEEYRERLRNRNFAQDLIKEELA